MRKDLKKFYNRKEFPKDENRSALNSYSKKEESNSNRFVVKKASINRGLINF
jgi:hypothetical protein